LDLPEPALVEDPIQTDPSTHSQSSLYMPKARLGKASYKYRRFVHDISM